MESTSVNTTRPAGVLSRRYRIALIDTNSSVADVLAGLFEKLGHETNTANDGPSGVELVKSMKPDVVFCCIELPGIDGYGVARAIRDSLSEKPLVVAHTAYGKWEVGKRAKEAGFDLIVAKPLALDQINRVFDFLEGSTECDDIRLCVN